MLSDSRGRRQQRMHGTVLGGGPCSALVYDYSCSHNACEWAAYIQIHGAGTYCFVWYTVPCRPSP